MSQGEDAPRADPALLLPAGFITKARAEELVAAHPELTGSMTEGIREAAAVEDWRRVETLANLAAQLSVPGLGEVLIELLDADIAQLNNEDMVEILGEIRVVDAASSLFRVVERSLESDAPAYWLCQKAIGSLCDLQTDEANEYLHTMTAATWPDPVRWYAAEALQIEDELGFDKDQMLGTEPVVHPSTD